MIVWVNGAFGSGKTSLVEELRPHWPDALVFDPEAVGFVLGQIVEVPTGDFQDLRLWRRQVADLAVGLVEEYRRPVLVPMTLVDPGHLGEIFGAVREAGIVVHHFFLTVPPEVLARRIEERTLFANDPEREEQVRSWCKSMIEPATAAVPALPADTVLLDGELTVPELAARVRAHIADSPS